MSFFTAQKTMSGRTFVALFFFAVAVVHTGAYILYMIDIPYFGLDAIRQHQTQKLEEADEDIDTIFVGDSSLGNAINEELFTTLHGEETMNLALMQGYGMMGSLQMAAYATALHPEIRNIVFFQTIKIWSGSFDHERFLELEHATSRDVDATAFFGWRMAFERVRHYTNFREYVRFAKYVSGHAFDQKAFENGYIQQSRATYRSGDINPKKQEFVEAIHPDMEKAYALIDAFCKAKSVNCVFVYGPIHEEIYNRLSPQYRERIATVLDTAQSLTPLSDITTLTNEYMGDEMSHVHVVYKDILTNTYFEKLAPLLK